MENRCKKRATPEKCLKYYTARLEEGKDVVKLLEFHKLEKEQKNTKEHQLRIIDIECLKRSSKANGSEGTREKKKQKCKNYYRTLVEKGRDVVEIFKFQKLKKNENKQNTTKNCNKSDIRINAILNITYFQCKDN